MKTEKKLTAFSFSLMLVHRLSDSSEICWADQSEWALLISGLLCCMNKKYEVKALLGALGS